jgi:hypothetical protein
MPPLLDGRYAEERQPQYVSFGSDRVQGHLSLSVSDKIVRKGEFIIFSSIAEENMAVAPSDKEANSNSDPI